MTDNDRHSKRSTACTNGDTAENVQRGSELFTWLWWGHGDGLQREASRAGRGKGHSVMKNQTKIEVRALDGN